MNINRKNQKFDHKTTGVVQYPINRTKMLNVLNILDQINQSSGNNAHYNSDNNSQDQQE